MQQEEQLIPRPKVENIAGIGKSELNRRVRNRTFPAPVKLGPRCTRWAKSEVLAWVDARLAERNAALDA